jgi:hypothetical protein
MKHNEDYLPKRVKEEDNEVLQESKGKFKSPDAGVTSPPRIVLYDKNANHQFFNKGDLVKVKHFSESPVMLVEEPRFKLLPEYRKLRSQDSYEDIPEHCYKKDKGKKILEGILCGWFTGNQEYVRNVFNSKDLIKLEVPAKEVYFDD